MHYLRADEIKPGDAWVWAVVTSATDMGNGTVVVESVSFNQDMADSYEADQVTTYTRIVCSHCGGNVDMRGEAQ